MKTIRILLIILTLLFSTRVLALTIDPDVDFIVGNETYEVNSSAMKFSSITIGDSYITFNSTRFVVTSGNDIIIKLVYLDNDISNANDDEIVLEFNAVTASGNVWFNISGLISGRIYTVKRNGTSIATLTANGSGYISFNNSVWSVKGFEILGSNATRRITKLDFGGNANITLNASTTRLTKLDFGGRANVTLSINTTRLTKLDFGGKVTVSPPWNNTCPTIEQESPTNGSTNESLYHPLDVRINDSDGNQSSVDWYCNDSGVWYHLQHNATVLNETARLLNFTNASACGTTYYWKVTANDGNCNISEWFWFMTLPCNNCPVLSNPIPANNSIDIDNMTAFWNITINDPDGNTFNWSIEVNNTDTNSSTGDTNGTKICNLTTPLAFSVTYTVWVNVTDGNCTVNETFYFTVEDEPLPFNITNEYPVNQSNIYVTQPTVYFNLTHPNGYTMNYSLYINNNTLVYTGNNVSNGTQVDANHLFYSANSTYVDYYWRIEADDGTDWVNETFTFQAVLQGSIVEGGAGFMVGIAMACALLAIGFVLIVLRRRKRDESY